MAMGQPFYMAEARNPAELDYGAPVKFSTEEKVKTGATITTVVSEGKAQNVVDIMDALRASLKETPKKKVVDSKMKKAASAKSVR